jgi:hypothetical protein
MNGNPSPTINPRRPGNSLHYSRPPKLFWANVGLRPVAQANAYSCGRVGDNEE